MADVSVKMGVSGIGQFKQGMSQAQANIKSVDAALKVNEKQLKLTGDAETYMQQKAQLLASKLQAQKSAVANADAALRQMKASGVDPLSTAYQNMQTQMLNATAAMMETETALQGVGQSADTAGKKTDAMAQNLQSINKKMSLEQVKGAIDNITSGMEAAAKKALELGNNIRESILEAANWADDAATAAQMYGIPLQQYLQMEAMAETVLDTSVDAILTSQQKLKKGIGKESKETMNTLKELGLAITEYGGKTSEGFTRLLYDDPEQMFWEAGKAIMAMGDAYEQEAAAQQLFGKSWRELVPLFTEFDSKESFTTALEGMNTNSDKTVEKLAALNDALNTLEHDLTVLKTEVLGALAPALQAAAEAISGMLTSLTEYLQTDEGKQQLQAMADALTAIVQDITNIDPEKVTQGFADIIGGIAKTFEWIEEHWEAVKTGLMGIAIGFGALKLASAGLTIAQLFGGITGGAGAGAAAGATAGVAGAGGIGLGTGMAVVALGAILCGPALAQIIKGEPEEAKEAAQTLEDATAALNGREANENASTNTMGQVLSGEQSVATITGDVIKGIGDNLAGRTDANEAIKKGFTSLFTGENGGWQVSDEEKWFYQKSDINPNVSNQLANTVYEVLKNLEAGKGYNEGLTDKHDYRYSTGYVEMFGEMISQFGTETAARVLQNPETWSVFSSAYNNLELLNSGKYTQWALDELQKRGFMDEPEETPKRKGLPKSTGPAVEVEHNGHLWDQEGWEGEPVEVPAEPKLEDDAKSILDAAIQSLGKFTITIEPILADMPDVPGHANGLPYVPFDGYLAMLHKGERVMTARENAQYSRSYNSNLYVESMYMNNGADAEGLAAEMAAAQRRTMSGFGS